MIYNTKKIDDNMFAQTLAGQGREVVNYYTNQTDKVLVEPNSQLDGGKIYCSSESWISRGDIIKISDNWYVVSQLSNLASDMYNIGVITMCDVKLLIKLGSFVYNIPAVASKYSGNSNVRGIIDDSTEGQLSFITGYHKEFDELTNNPCITVFGKVWQIGNYLNVNNVMTVYCQGKTGTIKPGLGIEPIPLSFKVGDKVDLKVHVLNTTKNTIPEDLKITLAGTNMGIVNGTTVTFTKIGKTSIVVESRQLGAFYQTPELTVS